MECFFEYVIHLHLHIVLRNIRLRERSSDTGMRICENTHQSHVVLSILSFGDFVFSRG